MNAKNKVVYVPPVYEEVQHEVTSVDDKNNPLRTFVGVSFLKGSFRLKSCNTPRIERKTVRVSRAKLLLYGTNRGNNREIYERGGLNSQSLPLRTKRIRSERRSTACSGTSTVFLKLSYPNNLLNLDLFFVNETSVKILGRDTRLLR